MEQDQATYSVNGSSDPDQQAMMGTMPPMQYVPANAPLYPSQMTESQFDLHFPFIPMPDEVFNHVPSGSTVIDVQSVMDESGRTFHGYKEGRYYFPNDAAEQDRLDLQHAAITILLDGRLFLAPMKKAPSNVIDVATGTGIWAMQFAEQNPTSNVIGTDLSAIQPRNPPPNVTFLKEDSEEEWVYPGITFDYVHLRFMYSCFDDHRTVMKHAFKSMTPGGWIEYLDTCPLAECADGRSLEGTAFGEWSQHFIDGALKKGRDFTVARRYKEMLIETGFVDVEEKKFMWPGNPWPEDRKLKRAGRYQMQNILDALRGISWKMLRESGLSPEQTEDLVSRLQKEVQDVENFKWYLTVNVVYGRKPLASETNIS